MEKFKIQAQKNGDGILKISFVKNPAIEAGLMAFSNEKDLFTFADEERMVFYAPAMIPNKEIYRKALNANVYFDAETIRDLHIDGCRNGYDNNINLNHDQDSNLTGVFCIESWIIDDATNDKATKMGFEMPEGTLMKGYKVDNPEVWSDVKNGKITGLSIEAYLEPVTDNLINMTKEELDARIRELMAEEAVPKKDYNVDKLEVGGIVTDAEGKPVKVDAILIDGKLVTSDENGVITAVEDPKEEEGEGEPAPDLQKRIDELTAENNDLKAKLAELEAGKTEMSAELDASKKVAMQMSAELEKGLKPEVKKMSEMTELERFKNKHLKQ